MRSQYSTYAEKLLNLRVIRAQSRRFYAFSAVYAVSRSTGIPLHTVQYTVREYLVLFKTLLHFLTYLRDLQDDGAFDAYRRSAEKKR